jgi:hypothetical protein
LRNHPFFPEGITNWLIRKSNPNLAIGQSVIYRYIGDLIKKQRRTTMRFSVVVDVVVETLYSSSPKNCQEA